MPLVLMRNECLALLRPWKSVVQRMAPKSWFQAKVYLPGTGLALMVIAFFFLMQAIPAAMCMLAPRSGWNSPLSQERINYYDVGYDVKPRSKSGA